MLISVYRNTSAHTVILYKQISLLTTQNLPLGLIILQSISVQLMERSLLHVLYNVIESNTTKAYIASYID